MLEVDNLLGQRVATLVNEVRPIGYYAVPLMGLFLCVWTLTEEGHVLPR